MGVDLFISYSHEDNQFAEHLQSILEMKHSVWMDNRIPNGSYWRTEIDRNLDAASLVVVIISPDSMTSAYVTYEWCYTLFRLHKEIYWVYWKECERNIGMFGRLMDFQIPLDSCLEGNSHSDNLNTVINDIEQRLQELPAIRQAGDNLTPGNPEELQKAAAEELAQVKYHKPVACEYLIRDIEKQKYGPVQTAIAKALFDVGDTRAVCSLWKLYHNTEDRDVKEAIVDTIEKLCR